jgi:hypothetical protein
VIDGGHDPVKKFRKPNQLAGTNPNVGSKLRKEMVSNTVFFGIIASNVVDLGVAVATPIHAWKFPRQIQA